MFAAYFVIFRFLILKLNLKTPGREEGVEEAPQAPLAELKVKPVPGTNASPLGETIVTALGGSENIENVDNCYTRLRLVLKDPNAVDEQLLKETGSKGVIKSGNNVQVVYGLNVKSVRDQVDQKLGGLTYENI
jgi:PTS system maltose and glucose-specific IIC component